EKTYACLNCLLGPTYGSRRLAGRLWRRYAGRRADVARGARNGIDEGEPVEFLLDYADFLLRTLTVVVAIILVLLTIAALRGKGRGKGSGHLQVSRLNDFYKALRQRLEHELLDK